MYRIMCNSLKNYAADFDNDIDNPRYSPVYFLQLIADMTEYQRHKEVDSDEYRQLTSFLWTLRGCESSEQILHELNILGVEGNPIMENIDFSETYRIWRMLLQMTYWRD